MRNTQTASILEHLNKKGSITSMEAFKEYGATRLSAIIYALRHQGYRITTEIIQVDTRYGRKTNIANYKLQKTKTN
jgi:hypothetical protein